MSDPNTVTTPAPGIVVGDARGRALQRAIPLAFFRDGLGTNPKTGAKIDLATAVIMAHHNEGKPVRLGIIIGSCASYSTTKRTQVDGSVTTTHLLLGKFKATRFADGATMTAGGCYLPSLFTTSTVAMLDQNKGTGLLLDFAMELGAVRDPRPDAPVAYQWTMHDLLAPTAVDPLAQVEASLIKHDLYTPVRPLPAIEGAGQAQLEAAEAEAASHVGGSPAPASGEGDVGELAAAEDAATKRAAKGRRAA